MIKQSTPMQCLQVDLLCDECNEPMRYTGYRNPTPRGIYHHVCPKGHTQAVDGEMFPRIEHIPAKPDWRAPMVVNET